MESPNLGRGWKSRVFSDRTAAALLLVSIAAASVLIVSVFSLQKSPAFAPSSSPGGSSQGANGTGVLRIAVSVVASVTSPGVNSSQTVVFYFPTTNSTSSGNASSVLVPPLQPVNFTIVGVGLSQPPIRVEVSQPGEVEVSARAGFYSMTTRNEYYNLSVSTAVSAGQVTEVDVNVTTSVAPAIFSEAADPDFSQVVTPWEQLTVKVANSASPPPRGGEVFLAYGMSESAACSGSCPAAGGLVASRVLQSDLRASGLWLVVAPLEPVALQGVGSLAVYAVEASYTVSTYGA